MAQSALNLRAAQEIDAEVVSLIGAGRSFVVETVLSSPKYRDNVEAAKAKGFQLSLDPTVVSPAAKLVS